MSTDAVTRLNLSGIETLILAGGGNRCWWQAVAIAHWLNEGWRLPQKLIGTSAGAGIAAACLSADGLRRAYESCESLFGSNLRMFEWRGLAPYRWHFAHQRIYPAWLASFVNEETFNIVRNAPQQLRVALTRPARALGLGGSVVAGTLAYLVDKYLWNRLHPRLPGMLGLRQEFVDLHQCQTLDQAQTLLAAAAAAPPFLRAQHVAGSVAIDGGYLDSVPIPEQNDDDRSRTLVLLTRHYPKLPVLFRHRGRSYLQPSRRVPVSTWDCTQRTDIASAFTLGGDDAEHAFRSGLLRLSGD